MVIEATPGTTTALQHFIPFIECSLGEIHEPIADNSAKGVRDSEGSASMEGKKHGEGSISVVLNATHSPYFFGLALGNISSTLVADVYVHTITKKEDSVPRTATIWRDRSVDQVAFPYAVVDSLELNFADDVASLVANVMSRYPIEGWTDTAVIETLELYTFKNAYIELTNGVTTSELKVKTFNLSIKNNAEMVYAPNDNDVDRIVSKNFEVSGSFTVLFESETQKDAYTDLTKQALAVTFEGSDTGKITITIPQFRLQSAPISTPIDDINEQTAEFVAEYDGSDTITVEITNAVDSYYT